MRVSGRGEWNETDMNSAIAAVKEKKIGLKKASKEFKRKEREDKKKPETLASKKRPNKSMTKQKPTQQAKVGPSWVHESDSESEGDSTVCLYCSDTIGNSLRGEGWVCCVFCKRWAHEQCAGMQDDEEEVFMCELCQ